MVLAQSSFQTIWASLFEMALEPTSLDWNGNKLEHKLELEDMKRTIYGNYMANIVYNFFFSS